MVSTPGEIPVTIPEVEPMVAIDGKSLIQVPPKDAVKVVVAPVQIAVTPDMGDGKG